MNTKISNNDKCVKLNTELVRKTKTDFDINNIRKVDWQIRQYDGVITFV